ncbi:hypothetical protein OsI_01551 [Oryza sativa Indica Group]|uniref:Uncharacterized protein n=1 Tax=Oryza sativa subsp. indica TaxID=39946 RepID=B8A6Q1_ORYSI|nr:hypothetical protein OsI_01551 [Oryza sativa Indica Group]
MELHRHWLAPYAVTHFLLFLRSRWRWSPPPPHVLPVQAEAEGSGLIQRADGRRCGSWPWIGSPSSTRRRGGTTVEEDGFAVAVVHVDLLLIPFLSSNMWIEGGGTSPPAANQGGLPQHFLMRGGSGSGALASRTPDQTDWHQHLQCALWQVDAHLDGMVVGNCSAEDGHETRKEHEKIKPVVVVPLECHPGHYPQHVLNQRSSPAANTKGQG